MSAYAFTALFNALVALLFGFWVFRTNPRQPANRRWLFLNVAIAAWTFSQFLREMSTSPEAAMAWGGHGIYVASAFIPVLYLHFIYDFTGPALPWRKAILPLAYGSGAAVAAAVLFTDLVIRGMVPNPFFRFYVDPGPLYPLFLVHFAGFFMLSTALMVVGIRRSGALKRDQLKIMLAALVLTVLGGSTSFLPVLKIEVFPFGNYFVSLYVFIYSYLVVRHQWLDINIFMRKSLSVILIILTLVIPVFILAVLAQTYFFGVVDPGFTLVTLGLIVLATLTFPRFILKAERTLEQLFFADRLRDRETVARLAAEAVSILDLPKLLASLTETLSRNFRATRSTIMVLDEKREQYRVQEAEGPVGTDDWPSLDLDSPWVGWLQAHPATLYREALPRREPGMPAGDLPTLMGVPLVLPLVVKSRLVGLILMGEREGGRPYSADDLELLRTLANQAAIAIENARLYEDLKRSRQYMRRADRLASLGTLAAGLAHEIRNPLVSIKTFIQLLPQRLDDSDFRTNFLSIANDEVERIRRLVEELLSFARPSEPDLQPADLNEAVEKTLLLVDNDIRHKGIRMERTLEAGLPEVLMDKEQIRQVILNILLNAIQAVEVDGRIAVTTRIVGLSGDRPMVQVEVSDNGPGISEEDQEHIFNPFFTTKQMGSGLGLAISHQIIKEHRGSLEVDSVRGNGTSFFLNLPLDPRRHDRRRNRDGQDPGR